MKKEKIKQIVLISLSVVFMGIGCLNFFYVQNESLEVSAESSRDELNLGDVQLVNSEVSNEQNINKNEDKQYLSEIVSNEELENIEISTQGNLNIEDVVSESNKDEYFVETKLERDSMYSEMLETYQKMLESAETGETQKTIAAQEINNINNIKNGIMISENLIKNKGFENVVILVNNGVASVVVKSSLLNGEQIAKIQNIVSRELNIDVQNINISNK